MRNALFKHFIRQVKHFNFPLMTFINNTYWKITKSSLENYKAQSGTLQSAAWKITKHSLENYKVQPGKLQSTAWKITKSTLENYRAQHTIFKQYKN